MSEPEDAGVASIRARLRAAMAAHERHPDWPCEDWGCADVDDLLRRLDAEHARLEAENLSLRDRAGVYRDWHPCQHTACTTENALRAVLGKAPTDG